MKIKNEDYQILKQAVIKGIQLLSEKYKDNVETKYQEAGLSPMRLRWDFLWASKLKIGDGVGAPGDVNIYAYANDDHIDTALRSIVKEQGLEWAAIDSKAEKSDYEEKQQE